MKHRSLIALPAALMLLAGPFSAVQAQDAGADVAAATTAAEAAPAPIAASPTPSHRACPKHRGHGQGAGKGHRKGHHGGRGCGKHGGRHGRHQEVLDRLERIEQRQVLIETMLRQLLEDRQR